VFNITPRRIKEILDKNKKTDAEVEAYQNSIELEKGDFLAMVIAALITFLPVLIVVMVIFYGVLWLFFLR